jgi:hypothetical protein
MKASDNTNPLINHCVLTMLPQYSKQYKSDDVGLEDGASEPFLARTSTDTAPPTYPPSTSGTSGRSNVQYSYDPIWPRKGDKKTAVGLMGRTKAVSLFAQLARRSSLFKGNDSNCPKRIPGVSRIR